MGFGFAAGNGAEDVKVFNPHGPEFGKVGFEGGENVVGLGHEIRIAEKRGEVKSAGGADTGYGRSVPQARDWIRGRAAEPWRWLALRGGLHRGGRRMVVKKGMVRRGIKIKSTIKIKRDNAPSARIRPGVSHAEAW